MRVLFPITATLLAGCGIVSPDEAVSTGAGPLTPAPTLAQRAYLKASNTDAGDSLGNSVALSADGMTLAVGAFQEDSAARGVDGDRSDNSAPEAGAVYVFVLDGNGWSQQAYLKASNTGAGDRFGYSLAMSGDGSRLVVGAPFEASAATGVDSDQHDDSAPGAGAVYVFERSGAAWSQQAYLKPFDTDVEDRFGSSVALSEDGAVVAVGAPFEDGAAIGVDGDPADDAAPNAGAVYVFERSGAGWRERAYVKASNTSLEDHFGISVAIAREGALLAVGADQEDSAAKGVDGDQRDDAASNSGAVYVFERDGATWNQRVYVKASNTGVDDRFGRFLAASADGSTLAVSAPFEASAATGLHGDEGDDSARGAGAVYVFELDGAACVQRAYVKASNTDAGDGFGGAVALSGDGARLVVGARDEDSGATGLDGNQADNLAWSAGAVYLFERRDAAWDQTSYVKASNTGVGDGFGASVAVSGDGMTLAASACSEDSPAIGVGGDQADNSAPSAGAAYLFD